MVLITWKECPKEIVETLAGAEDAYMEEERLMGRYYTDYHPDEDYPLLWPNGILGTLEQKDLTPAFYWRVIGSLREELARIQPVSYAAVKEKLTVLEPESPKHRRRNDYFDSVTLKEHFPKNTEEEVIAFYIVDALKLCDTCNALIKKLEKMIMDA